MPASPVHSDGQKTVRRSFPIPGRPGPEDHAEQAVPHRQEEPGGLAARAASSTGPSGSADERVFGWSGDAQGMAGALIRSTGRVPAGHDRGYEFDCAVEFFLGVVVVRGEPHQWVYRAILGVERAVFGNGGRNVDPGMA